MNNMQIQDIKSIASRDDISATLSRIRNLTSTAKAFGTSALGAVTPSASFQSILSVAKDAIQSVNHAELNTNSLKNAYMTGDQTVSLSQVMVSSIKSKVAFEGLVAVRNKLIDAYKDIMNIPI